MAIPTNRNFACSSPKSNGIEAPKRNGKQQA